MSDAYHEASQQGELLHLRRTVERLETQIEHLERRLERQSERTHVAFERLPQTALLSSKFLERAFAVWGDNLVANLILSLIPLALWCVLALLGVALWR